MWPVAASPQFERSTTPQPWPTSQVRLTFATDVPMTDVEGTLELARIATEAVHGEGRVEFAAACSLDPDHRDVRIDTTCAVGRTLALIFLGYARREFGRESVTVERAGHAHSCVGGSAA